MIARVVKYEVDELVVKAFEARMDLDSNPYSATQLDDCEKCT